MNVNVAEIMTSPTDLWIFFFPYFIFLSFYVWLIQSNFLILFGIYKTFVCEGNM